MKNNTNLFKRINCFVKSVFKSKETNFNFIEDINNPVIIELSQNPKNKSVVAVEYGINVKILNRWLEEKNLNLPRGIICPGDLKKIYAMLGIPKNIKPGKS